MVADKLSKLNHYFESTGKYAELKQQQENEEAAKEERRIEDAAWLHSLGSKETGEQIELQERTHLQIRRPSPQQSNVTSFIENVINKHVENYISSKQLTRDVINKDPESISSGNTTALIENTRYSDAESISSGNTALQELTENQQPS